jgi:uncharacterized membrane protein YphA (DoxX/SURF4 family)
MANFTLHGQSPTQLLLRAGLALMFIYAAISSTTNPNDWIGYLPEVMREHFNAHALLHVFSVWEAVLAIWLLSGQYVKWAALAVAATLGGIVVANFSLFAITFRDMALMLCALALYFTDTSSNSSPTSPK